jgi:prepilin-type N-terminal cleavage/methylation domain-containing protein
MYNQKVSSQSNQGGFTLIELLIAMAIMGVLSSSVVIAINPQQLLAQTRDSKRLQSLSQIVNAAEAFSTRHKGLYPPGYSGSGPYGNNCSSGKYMYPDLDLNADNCVSNSLITEGDLKRIPVPEIQNTNAPDQCRDYFYFHVIPSTDWFGQIGAVNSNEHYMMQFCMEGWSNADLTKYRNDYNDGAYLYNDYPTCYYYSSRKIVQCYLYDWQKLPPLRP